VAAEALMDMREVGKSGRELRAGRNGTISVEAAAALKEAQGGCKLSSTQPEISTGSRYRVRSAAYRAVRCQRAIAAATVSSASEGSGR
jgi:hypothetical protein